MKILVPILLAFALTACFDPEVSRVSHPERAYVKKSTQTCDAGPGYCCEYGMGFDGKFDYSCGMKYSCDGTQPVTLSVTPVTIKHKSGAVRQSEIFDTVSVDGECQD